MFVLSEAYDIINPENGQRVGFAKEVVPWWVQILRFAVSKKQLPTTINMIDHPDDKGNGRVALSIKRGFTMFRSKVSILINGDTEIGYFRSKLLTLSGGFTIFDRENRKVGEVKGDWKGWNFKMVDDTGKELGVVTKKWTGLGQELFTSADTYMISLNKDAVANEATRALLLAAGLAIDTVYMERG